MDLSTWYTEEQAAGLMGISERTLRRRCDEQNGPERQLRPVAGRKPEPVYRPEDVDRMKLPRPAVFAASNPLLPQKANGLPAPPTAAVDQMEAFAAMLNQVVDRVVALVAERTPVPAPAAMWLTIEEASRYTGLSQTLISLLARGGKIKAVRDHATKVLRTDLDTLRDPSRLSRWREELGGATNELRQAIAKRKVASSGAAK